MSDIIKWSKQRQQELSEEPAVHLNNDLKIKLGVLYKDWLIRTKRKMVSGELNTRKQLAEEIEELKLVLARAARHSKSMQSWLQATSDVLADTANRVLAGMFNSTPGTSSSAKKRKGKCGK